nr:hypothetical protein [Leucobacter salsicius]
MIDWMAFVTVFGAALGSSVFVVALYSLGIRFLATPVADGSGASNGPARDDEEDDIEEAEHPRWATSLAYLFFGLAGLAAVAGVFLIVPALHPW